MRQPNVDLEHEIRIACSEVTGLEPEQLEVLQRDENFWETQVPAPSGEGEGVPVTFLFYPGQSSPDVLEPHTYWVISVAGGGMECCDVVDAPGIAVALAEAFEDYGLEWDREFTASAPRAYAAPEPAF